MRPLQPFKEAMNAMDQELKSPQLSKDPTSAQLSD
jgi:hypothetical protein